MKSIKKWGKKWGAVVIALAVLFAISALMASAGTQAIANLAAVPAIAGLFWALLVIARDRIAHDRAVFIQEKGHSFSIGVMSHMANVAFDKHVKFCQEYASEMQKLVSTLYGDGPSRKVLEHAANLAEIRSKRALWLVPEIETELGKFEGSLRKMGADILLLDAQPVGPERTATVDRIYSRFAELMGLPEWQGKKIEQEVAVATTLEKLIEILGVDALSNLRSVLLEKAHRALLE